MSMAVHGRGTDPIVRFSAVGHESDVADIIAATGDGTPRALTAVFASADYDLAELAAQLRRRGVRRIIGAVTGRVIGSDGFTASGAVGFHLPVDRFAAADTVFDDAAGITLPELRRRAQELRMQLESGPGAGMPHRFALLLVDAESRSEERLAAVLGMELNGVPLIGGSAGDLYFNPLGHASGRACLLRNGEVGRGAAVLCMVASASGVAAYCHNHYLRSDKKLVITDADPARRLVREIDGRPALEVYSAACGFRRPPSESRDFAPFPLMIRIGGNYYARGMQRIYADGALEFACALEPGLVVSLGKPGDMVTSLSSLYAAMHERIGMPELVIGVDCAARTAYMERECLTDRIQALHGTNRVVGFSSLGEQFNTMHANNSFTCLGIASP